MFVDAFLGSGVPLSGDPITSFEIVPLLGLRTGTILNNRRLMVRDVLKVRFIAINCGERRLEIARSFLADGERHREDAERNAITLLPGESIEHSIFRSWDTPGEHQVTLAYEVRCDGHPFARVTYPRVPVHVRAPLTHWNSWVRVARSPSQ